MSLMKIAFVGFGEVASALSPALQKGGAAIGAYDTLLSAQGGAERLASRAGSTPVTFAALPDAIRGAKYVISTVTTSVARAAAQDCAALLAEGQVYLDLNATEPGLKNDIGGIVEASGARFVEGALLGAVGVTGAKTEILLGGPHARSAQPELSELGLNVRFYSEEIGKASMFKMLRSVFSKGMEALLIEFLVAAERADLREDLWSEVTTLFASQPFEKVALNWVRSHSSAHARRREEVRQVAGVLRDLGIEPIVTSAALAMFERSGQMNLEPAKTADEVIHFFHERL